MVSTATPGRTAAYSVRGERLSTEYLIKPLIAVYVSLACRKVYPWVCPEPSSLSVSVSASASCRFASHPSGLCLVLLSVLSVPWCCFIYLAVISIPSPRSIRRCQDRAELTCAWCYSEECITELGLSMLYEVQVHRRAHRGQPSFVISYSLDTTWSGRVVSTTGVFGYPHSATFLYDSTLLGMLNVHRSS